MSITLTERAAQEVKTKSASQGAPRRSARETVLPLRSVRVKSGTAPRSGNASNGCGPPHEHISIAVMAASAAQLLVILAS